MMADDPKPLPTLADRVARLEAEYAKLKALMKRNGWTVKD